MYMMQGTVTIRKPIEVTDADFDQQVLDAVGPVVVDFWAPWCPPCRVIGPILAELANEYAGRLTIAKVNIDEQQRSMIRYGIQGAPTLVIFKDGKEVERLVGARRKSHYQAHFDAVLQVADA
jgi:thioredoxin 1